MPQVPDFMSRMLTRARFPGSDKQSRGVWGAICNARSPYAATIADKCLARPRAQTEPHCCHAPHFGAECRVAERIKRRLNVRADWHVGQDGRQRHRYSFERSASCVSLLVHTACSLEAKPLP